MHNGDVLGDEGRKALNACVKVRIYGKPETRKYDGKAALERLWALDDCDKRSYVDKYPREGPGSDKLRDLIDKRRADVERELEEATADPERRRRYSWVVAQRRVRDCFAGNFAEDRWTLSGKAANQPYSIIDIHKAFVEWDKERERADEQRVSLLEEYAEAASASADSNKLCKYYQGDAIIHLKECFYHIPVGWLKGDLAPKTGMPKTAETTPSYDIFDIHKALLQFNGRKLLEKYPEEGPGSDELKKLIDEHRGNLEEEFQKATCDTDDKPSLREYSRSEAERRVRDCFAGTFLSGFPAGDTEIFHMVTKDESDQTYDIFDIKNAIESFDAKTFVDAFKYQSEGTPKFGESKQKVDEQRASIQQEYEIATTNVEIEHGSGFIVHDHFIITNWHVIDTYLNESKSHEIRISNEAIGELACKVVHYDAGKDLALLYCPDLNLEQSGICPLQLSSQSLLPGMSIFSFGYPMSHTGETALFVSGNVSGSKKKYGGPSVAVLNCALNSGNSGGPVLCWVKGQLRVVGVATQKHIKDILTLEEMKTIERIRKSLQTHAIPDVPEHVGKRYCSFTDHYLDRRNCQTPMFLLTLKLFDALETHSQFNLSNALPGHLVVEFIENSISKNTGECKEELAEIVKLSEDPGKTKSKTVDSDDDSDEENSDEQDFDSQMREKVRNKLKKRKAVEDVDNEDETTTKERSEISKQQGDSQSKIPAARAEYKRLKRELMETKIKKDEKEKPSKESKESDILAAFHAEQKSYLEKKKAAQKRKGEGRDEQTLALLASFKTKLSQFEEEQEEKEDNEPENEDDDDTGWMFHSLQCETQEKRARDVYIENEDTFEIFDPRNPINKRRREASKKTMKDKRR
ncbi:hypothetical protein ACROYT_G042784 [Oculina patagonica]